MRIWLVQTWEPNRIDDPNLRPWRTGILAQRLIEEGHEVLWWASQFSHYHKKMREAPLGPNHFDDGLTIWLLEALGYRRNLGRQRLRDHQHVADQFVKIAHQQDAPDLIVSSYPTIEINHSVKEYAKSAGVPWLVDVRDQYPDLYWENLPQPMSTGVRAISALMGYQQQARSIFAAATGITANGQGALEWALQYGGRTQSQWDACLPMSYQAPTLAPDSIHSLQSKWREQFGDSPLAIYSGALGKTLDFQFLQNLVKVFEQCNWKFAICGAGPLEADIKKIAQDSPAVEFLGWLSTPELVSLQSICTVGVAPYKQRRNFEGGVPNKPVEYLANGLPVLTSLAKGTIVDQLNRNGCGFTDAANRINALTTWLKESDWGVRSRAASSLFQAEYHPDIIYGRWMELIRAVTQN